MPAVASKAPMPDPDHNLYRRGASYYVRYEYNGQEYRKSLGTTDVTKARKARDKILRELNSPRHDPAKTWEDAVNGYLALTETLIRNLFRGDQDQNARQSG